MASESIICRRCGVANVAGDQFCGSCGAFLEWEGEASSADASATPLPPAAPPATAPPLPPTAPPPATPPAQTAPGSVGATRVCPACGIVNPSQRTFCQSCGTVLDRSAGSGAAAPAASSAAASSGAKAPAPGARPEPGSSGGLPGWLPAVVGLGLLIGVAAVIAAVVLRPSAPAARASAFPSATFTPTLAPTPPVSPAGSTDTAGPGPSAAPTVAASVQLTPTGATASSVVGNRDKFAAAMAIDGALDTCWQEGATDEAGEWIEVSFAAARLDYVVVYAGYQLSHDAFLANLRPENVIVSVDGGPPEAFVLSDSEQPQRLDITDVPGATGIRIQIASTFPSEATAYPGSPFDDLAISEIRIFGEAGG